MWGEMEMSDGFENLPEVGSIHTFGEISDMDLPDSPCMEFVLDGITGWIQDSHITVENLKTCEGLMATKWRYLYTTREWIPVFRYADEVDLRTVLDIELMDREKNYTPDEDPDTWWATPKGFPREQ